MKVVLDSSVLIAAAISRSGVCVQLLEDVIAQHELAMSDYIAEEVSRKLREKFHFPEKEIRMLLRFLRSVSLMVVPAALPSGICRDPTDLPVLGTAVAAHAACLVTVDKDLLAIGRHAKVVIIAPRRFWSLAPDI